MNGLRKPKSPTNENIYPVSLGEASRCANFELQGWRDFLFHKMSKRIKSHTIEAQEKIEIFYNKNGSITIRCNGMLGEHMIFIETYALDLFISNLQRLRDELAQ